MNKKQKTITICFANNKGGSGKSTSCANLGYELAMSGKKVLLVDGDMQLNLSLSFFDEETRIWLDWMRLIGCGWQIWLGILPVSRQIKHLKIRTVHGISEETVLKMKEKRRISSNFVILNIGNPQNQ